jgi:hypothetical protein
MYDAPTPNQVRDVIVWWYGNPTDPVEIELPDPTYSCNQYITKMLPWLVNIYIRLTERSTAMQKLVLESATRDRLATIAFSGLIAQYGQVLQK